MPEIDDTEEWVPGETKLDTIKTATSFFVRIKPHKLMIGWMFEVDISGQSILLSEAEARDLQVTLEAMLGATSPGLRDGEDDA